MTIKEFFSFRQNRFFWLNILAMVIVVVALLMGTFKWIDAYTRHGKAVVVPDVKGMTVAEAGKLFADRGLNFVVSDSVYEKGGNAGCVMDCNPASGQKVKEGRTVYLTINTLNVPLQAVPDVADNSSLREAEARLLASGFRLDSIERMAGEIDWVYGVKYKGVMLADKAKVPIGSILTLMVGDGNTEVLLSDSDSLSLEGIRKEGDAEQQHSAADESWF